MTQKYYKRVFAIRKRLEEQVKKVCPTMDNSSGIYFYTRVDVDGKKYGYIGQAKDLLKRNADHLNGYQHIDISLRKKRGFYSQDNPYGWKLNFLKFPENQLNEREAYYIKAYLDAGYELYNIESGGSTGKTMINDRKPARGYLDGIKQGKKTIKEELAYLLDKYLVVSLKKSGKLAEKALVKFNNIIFKD